MSVKIAAAESFPTPPSLVVVREYNHQRDKVAVKELERRCEAAADEKPSIVTDMGDPISRIRNFSCHLMLVAEYGKEKEIVGVIRCGIKSVTPPNQDSEIFSNYVKFACIIGLRVSIAHRRLGIGQKLIQELEEKCRKNGVKYTYMATEFTNIPSINLFTQKCNYIKFRTPKVLAQPVHAHHKPLDSSSVLIRVPPDVAELIYRRIFLNSEFFPNDIDIILKNQLNLGTFMAVPKNYVPINWDIIKSGIFPSNYAILSIWNTTQVYRLKVEGISPLKYAFCKGSRVLDKFFPWLKLPSIPNIFKYFGYYFLFGTHMEGEKGRNLMNSLCCFAHNMANEDPNCCFVVAELSQEDPIREVIPHWRKFSWDDLWCIKRLSEIGKDEEIIDQDWIKSPVVSFVDPREF